MNKKKIDFTIRQATKDDACKVLELIKELAFFEDLLSEVTATEELLKDTLFGINSSSDVTIAHTEDAILGYALYFETFSTFLGKKGLYLEDLYVRERSRGIGVGKALFREIARKTLEIGGGRLEWSVLNWNKKAIGFYQKMGALPMKEWTTFRLKEENLQALIDN